MLGAPHRNKTGTRTGHVGDQRENGETGTVCVQSTYGEWTRLYVRGAIQMHMRLSLSDTGMSESLTP
jgi:hypothetical protein